MTPLDYSNLNDHIAIFLLEAVMALMVTVVIVVVVGSMLDSRSMQPRYRTDAWFMRIAVEIYDVVRKMWRKLK